MRGLRSFLLLLIILAGLGAYIYFVESKREPGTGNNREKVFSVETDAIDEITIRAESGDATTVKKTGETWQIVQPATLEPDPSEIAVITSNLVNLEIQRVIDENPSDLAEFGLATPRAELTFKAGGQEHKILLGRKTPPGTDVYVKLANQPRVFLVPSYIEASFSRTTFDLRDKTVLKFDGDAVDTVTITMPSRTMRFAKRDNEWRLVAPFDARANSSAIEGLVNQVTSLEMKSIATEDPKSLAEFGLDKPAVSVQLTSGSSQATLVIGKEAGEELVFAKDQARPAVLRIEASVLDDLKKNPGEYRQTDLFDARPFNTTRLEIVRKGEAFAFEKTKVKNKEGQEEEKWRQAAPTSADVDPAKMDNLLTAVTQARALSFVDSTAKTGLNNPELSIAVTSGDSRRESVTFNRTGSDTFAARTGEPGAAKVEAATLDNIVKALEELQKPAEKKN